MPSLSINRLRTLDISRGVAALGVVVWHWQHFYVNAVKSPESFDRTIQPLYPYLKIFYEYGAKGVEYFFILSGFVFFWIYQQNINSGIVNFKDFLIHRFSRLYPLHLLTLFLVLILQKAYYHKIGYYFIYEKNDFLHFMLNLFFASSWGLESGYSFNGPTWSVSVEILLYFIFFAIAKWTNGGIRIIIGTMLLAAISHKHLGWLTLHGLDMFMLGGLIQQLTHRFQNINNRQRYLIYGIGILSWSLLILHVLFPRIWGLVDWLDIYCRSAIRLFPTHILFPSTIFSLVLWEIRHPNNFWLKEFSFIGDLTYSSYLIHFPLQMIFMFGLIAGVLPHEFYREPSMLVFFMFILICISLLAFHFIEKPCQSFLRNYFND